MTGSPYALAALALLAVHLVGCSRSCEEELEARLKSGLPERTSVETCSSAMNSSYKPNFQIEATLASEQSLEQLADRWGLQRTGLSLSNLTALWELSDYPENQRDVSDRAPGAAIRLRDHVATTLRQEGPKKYRIRMRGMSNMSETTALP